MASIDEVGRLVRGALEQLPQQGVAGAVDALDTASATVRETVAGSNNTAATELVDSFRQATSLTRDVQEQVRLLQSKIRAYLDRLGGSGTSSPPARRQKAGDRPRRGKRLSAAEVSELAESLPPPVPDPNVEGNKTHGVWLDEEGNRHRVVSGRDDDATEAWRLLKAQGIPLRAPAARVSDVEQKVAARMAREECVSMDILINNVPCEGPYGCDSLVPVILPAGYALTVYGPNYKKTFRGGATPWWR